MSDLVCNSQDRFSCVAAHIMKAIFWPKIKRGDLQVLGKVLLMSTSNHNVSLVSQASKYKVLSTIVSDE